jgi:hypothetical protein
MKHFFIFLVLGFILLSACTSVARLPNLPTAASTATKKVVATRTPVKPTETKTPTSTPTATQTVENTPTETVTPTEVVQENIPESVMLNSREDAFGGKLEIDPVGAKDFYKAILQSYLQSGVNNEYFYKNFGIYSPNDPKAVDLLLKKMEIKDDYTMPAGLTSLRAGQIYLGILRPIGEFDIKTIVISVLNPTEFQKRLNNGVPATEIKGADYMNMCQNGEWTYGIRIFMDKDGITKLNLILASQGGDPRAPMNSIDWKSANSIANINTWLDFFPFIIRQMKYARQTRTVDGSFLNLNYYFYDHSIDGLIVRADKHYDRNSLTPVISPVKLAAK